jgi:glucan 1,3-beta-glucosidase
METTMTQQPKQGGGADARPASAPQQPTFASGARPGSGAVGDAGGAASGAPKLSSSARAALRAEFRGVLDAGVHGLCFSPYLEGQAPGSQVSAEQIAARLEVIRPCTRWVRTFSCTEGHEQTPAIAHAMGIKTLVGAWLGTDAEINTREIEGVIAVARAGHADIVAVGNEVLLREDLSEDELIAHIEQVRHALRDLPTPVPVGYVDAYYLFEQHPRVTAACDVVMTNCYPFWEGCPREQALPYMQSMMQRTRAAAPGKRVLISETGWPDQGSGFHGAVPSEEGAMRYFIETLRWAHEESIELFYFAAFDEAWKVGAEGDVGAYWGLWDKDAQPKFG